MYQLFCDSNSELWYTKAQEYGLKVIRMPYTIDGTEYFYDLGENTDFRHFFTRMREGSKPITSAINEQNYVDYFDPVLAEGKDIFYVTFSHKMSATFESMKHAIAALKEKYPDRTVRWFDTKSISVGTGMQVEFAAEKWLAGATMDELEEALTEFRSHVHVYFIVDDLVYLKRGGRISPLTAAVGSLLNLKPLIMVKPDGSLESIGTIRGSKKVNTKFLSIMEECGCDPEVRAIKVVQADCPDMGDALIAQIKNAYGGDVAVEYQPVGPVIGCHCGPGTLGLIFYGKSKEEEK